MSVSKQLSLELYVSTQFSQQLIHRRSVL